MTTAGRGSSGRPDRPGALLDSPPACSPCCHSWLLACSSYCPCETPRLYNSLRAPACSAGGLQGRPTQHGARRPHLPTRAAPRGHPHRLLPQEPCRRLCWRPAQGEAAGTPSFGGWSAGRAEKSCEMRRVLCAAPAVPKLPWGPRPPNRCCRNIPPTVLRPPCTALSWRRSAAAWQSPWWREVRLLKRCIGRSSCCAVWPGALPLPSYHASGALQTTAAGVHFVPGPLRLLASRAARRQLQQPHCGVWGPDGRSAGCSHLHHRGWAGAVLPCACGRGCRGCCCCHGRRGRYCCMHKKHHIAELHACCCTCCTAQCLDACLQRHTPRPPSTLCAGQGGQQANNGVQIAHQSFESSGNAGMRRAQEAGSPLRLWLKVGWAGASWLLAPLEAELDGS